MFLIPIVDWLKQFLWSVIMEKIIATNKVSGHESTYDSKTAMKKALNVSTTKIKKAIDTKTELTLSNGDILLLKTEGTPYGQKGFKSCDEEIEGLKERNKKMRKSIVEFEASISSNEERIEVLKKTSDSRKLIDAEIEAERQKRYAELEKSAA